ncbi:hypothetical protein RhiLY_08278 [Ceratobasidium sp. AG-Ba]|nr:hypothetical protein RhiLY_08278 [Ceratobasidium sp. AG-Ba]
MNAIFTTLSRSAIAYTRTIFVASVDEMARVGLEYRLYPSPEQTIMVAYTAAQLIIEGLPPIGYVRVYDAVIDGKACYAYFIGDRNTPLYRISSITVQQFYNLFEPNPEEYTQGDDRWNWRCGSKKLRLICKIMTRRGYHLTN